MATCRKVCLLGNYSGRNAGDAAILGGALREISSRYPDVEFVVPTLNPGFVRQTYGGFRVRPVSLLPWTGSAKLLGWPAWKAVRDADLVLVTDAILFEHKLWNPLQNYLSTLALLLPLAKRRGIPIAFYNVSAGPANTAAGRWCLARVARCADLMIFRDDASPELVASLGAFPAPVRVGADSALSAPMAADPQIDRLLDEAGLGADDGTPRIGINLNSYGDAYVRHTGVRVTKERLLDAVARAAQRMRAEVDARIWLFGTQHMDLGILRELQQRLGGAARTPLLDNRRYGFAQLTGFFSRLDLLVGMRTHSLILASSVGTPLLGIVAYPKTAGYLRRIGQAERAVAIGEIEKLPERIVAVWAQREAIREELQERVEAERARAWEAATHLAPWLGD